MHVFELMENYLYDIQIQMWFVGVVEASVHVPIQYQGTLIGLSGEHIVGLERQSGCKIQVCLLINSSKIINGMTNMVHIEFL